MKKRAKISITIVSIIFILFSLCSNASFLFKHYSYKHILPFEIPNKFDVKRLYIDNRKYEDGTFPVTIVFRCDHVDLVSFLEKEKFIDYLLFSNGDIKKLTNDPNHSKKHIVKDFFNHKHTYYYENISLLVNNQNCVLTFTLIEGINESNS